MESLSKNTIFGLKMMVKSGLKNPSIQEDTYLYYWTCDFGHFKEVKKNSIPHGGISKRFFSRPLFTIIFSPKNVFLDADSILRVKMMYESVKW